MEVSIRITTKTSMLSVDLVNTWYNVEGSALHLLYSTPHPSLVIYTWYNDEGSALHHPPSLQFPPDLSQDLHPPYTWRFEQQLSQTQGQLNYHQLSLKKSLGMETQLCMELNFLCKSQLTQLRLFKPSKEKLFGSTEFSKQNLKQIGHNILEM